MPPISWRGARVLSRLTSLLKIPGWEADLQRSLGTGLARTAPSDTSCPWALPSTVRVPVCVGGTRCPIQGELLPHRPSLPRAPGRVWSASPAVSPLNRAAPGGVLGSKSQPLSEEAGSRGFAARGFSARSSDPEPDVTLTLNGKSSPE